MKFLSCYQFLILCVAFKVSSALPRLGPQIDFQIIQACKQKVPIDMGEFNMAMEGKMFTKSDGRPFECFLHCLYERYGFMTPSGDFKIEYIIEQLSLVDAIAPILEPMVHHCTDLHLYDKCERALEFTKCFWKMSSSVVTSEEPQTTTDKFFNSLGFGLENKLDQFKSTNWRKRFY